jgi:hypothetical protein
MSEVYAITDLEGYANEMRTAAAKSLSANSKDNLDEYISINQMINLVRTECVGYDHKDRPLLNEESNEQIYEKTVIWMHNVGLAKLAAKGLVECAWDSENNEMVFWTNHNINKPVKKKRKSNAKSIKRRSKKKDQGS